MKPSSNTPHDVHFCLLSRKVSDAVGRLGGKRYFEALIPAVTEVLDLEWGSLYTVNVDAGQMSGPIVHSGRTAVACNEAELIDIPDVQNVFGDSRSAKMLTPGEYETGTPSGIQSLVAAPLYNLDDILCGLLMFAGQNRIVDEESVLEVIEAQIPRAAAELERQQTRKSLKKLERNYSNLIDASMDATWEADTSGYLASISKECEPIYGYCADEIVGKSYTELMTDTAADAFKSNLESVLEGKRIYNVIADHVGRNNRQIKACYNITPKFDENSQVVGVIGTTRDISASLKAQETIKNNSELFSTILARLPVIFFRVNEKGNLIDIRGNGLKRMGVEDMDWVGKPGYGLFIGMDKKIDSALSGDTVFFENKGTYKGTPWWFYTSMFYDSWSGYGAVGFSVDITEQKLVEEQLVELLNKNRRLAQKLVEVQEEERRILARELHDELGQSITAVKSLATVMSASAGNKYTEIRSLSNSIIDLSGRLYEVVNNIMQRLRPDVIDGLDFSETIKNCIVRSQLETVGVNCDLEVEGNINDVDEFVKVTIYRIVQECLTNISKHAMASNVLVQIQRHTRLSSGSTKFYNTVQGEDDNIRVAQRDCVTVQISDDGIGMSVDKAANTRKLKKSHGLQGMHERVTAIGGSLEISGEHGKGVTVRAEIMLDSNSLEFVQDIDTGVSESNAMKAINSGSKMVQTG